MDTTIKKKAVFLDIDGTLIHRDQGPFTEDTDAMEEAARMGHALFLNTGRSFANISRTLLDLPSIRGIAAGGGAHVLLRDSADGTSGDGTSGYKTIYRKWVSEGMIAKILDWYTKHLIQCVLEGERNCYVINGPYGLFAVHNLLPVNSLEDFNIKSRGDYVTKLTLNRLSSEEEQRLLESYFKVNCFPNYVEGIVKGENKAKAMEIILQELGLRREDSIAIGDSANDLDMMHYAGLGIAMGNATDELKAAAAAVTADCGKGGVSEALRRFVLS